MKKIIFILLALLPVCTLQAQQPDEAAKRELEREVKTTGNYLYGEAVADTKDEAIKAARTVLVSEINKEALNHHDWQFAKTIQAKNVEYAAETIDLMRGNKFRIIAYIKKDSVSAVFDGNLPEVKLQDKNAIEQQPEKQPANIASASPQPEITETVIETPKSQTDIIISNGDLLPQIVNASSLQNIQDILVAAKKKGKAAYGSMDKHRKLEAAYLIVYKPTGEIVAILDKGNNRRTNLISGATHGKEIFNNNKVIWFQLFNE